MLFKICDSNQRPLAKKIPKSLNFLSNQYRHIAFLYRCHVRILYSKDFANKARRKSVILYNVLFVFVCFVVLRPR